MNNVVVSHFSLCVSQGGGHFETLLPGYVNIEGIGYAGEVTQGEYLTFAQSPGEIGNFG